MVIWSKTAKAQLQKAYNYIVKDSLQNAQIVRDKIIELTIEKNNGMAYKVLYF